MVGGKQNGRKCTGNTKTARASFLVMLGGSDTDSRAFLEQENLSQKKITK
tara:strand:- start:406 stop:555 length:150 start_codon:yes stop_codon:yes gene_type:complete